MNINDGGELEPETTRFEIEMLSTAPFHDREEEKFVKRKKKVRASFCDEERESPELRRLRSCYLFSCNATEEKLFKYDLKVVE